MAKLSILDYKRKFSKKIRFTVRRREDHNHDISETSDRMSEESSSTNASLPPAVISPGHSK